MNAQVAAQFISSACAPILTGLNTLEIERCWETVFFRN
jgi:hypothetical protein